MADSTARFAVSLEDETSGAAEAAAGALQQLKGKIDADTAALRQMQASMKALQGGTSVSIEAFKNLSSQIEKKKQSIAEANAAFIELGGSFRKNKKPADDAGNSAKGAGAKLKALADAAKGATPQLGGMLGRIQNLAKGLGAAGLAGVAVVATLAVVALGAAVAGAIAVLARFGLVASDAARSELLLLEAATGSADGAGALADAVGRVSRNVAISRNEVSGFAKQLAKAKLSGNELESALEAVSIAAAVGEDAGALVREIEKAKKAGKDVGAIADEVKAKFGGVASKQMLGFGVQVKKAKENLAGLFSGLNLEPFLAALKDVLSIFDSSTASGAALQAIVETMLQPLFDGVAAHGPSVKDMFRQAILWALKLGIAALDVGLKIKEAFSGESSLALDMLGTAAKSVAIFFAVLGAAVLAVVAVFGAMIGIAAAVNVAIITGIVQGVGLAIDAFAFLGAKVGEAIEFLRGLDFAELGKQMMQGLANGIMNGASAVVDAAKGAAKAAVGAVKGALGIASPSKLFAGLGMQTSAGMAEGIEHGSGDVENAAASMISIPREAPEAARPGPAVSGGGSTTITIETVNVHGVEGADDPSFTTKLADAFERALATMGGEPETT